MTLSRRSRLVGAITAVLIVGACGAPDEPRFSAPPAPPSTVSAADPAPSDPATTDPVTTDPVTTEASVSSGPDPAGTDPVSSGTVDGAASDPVNSVPSADLATELGATAVVPWGPVTAADIGRALTQVSGMTPAQKAGSVVMAASGVAVDSTVVGDLGLAGVNLLGSRGVLDGTTAGRPGQVAAVTAALAAQVPVSQAGFALLVATDQENGTVTRLINGFTELPGAGALGTIGDLNAAVAATREVAAISAAELAAVGINLDFAPVSDLLPLRGSSGIGDRSFGTDPARVAALVTAAVQGYQDAGVATSLKHFPGLGEVAADSHVTLATLKTDCGTWNTRASVPVRAGVDAGAAMVMTGHTLFPAVDPGSEPTSLSTGGAPGSAPGRSGGTVAGRLRSGGLPWAVDQRLAGDGAGGRLLLDGRGGLAGARRGGGHRVDAGLAGRRRDRHHRRTEFGPVVVGAPQRSLGAGVRTSRRVDPIAAAAAGGRRIGREQGCGATDLEPDRLIRQPAGRTSVRRPVWVRPW